MKNKPGTTLYLLMNGVISSIGALLMLAIFKDVSVVYIYLLVYTIMLLSAIRFNQ